MVYVFGTIGFIGGFILALYLLKIMLANRSSDELLEDRGLKWTYGLFAWVVAIVGAYLSVAAYGVYF